jgi:hypothetical protein
VSYLLALLASAIVSACEAPMVPVRGHITTDEARAADHASLVVIQLDGNGRFLKSDSVLVQTDGAYGKYLIRASRASRLRFIAAQRGYRSAVVELAAPDEHVDIVQDFVLRP